MKKALLILTLLLSGILFSQELDSIKISYKNLHFANQQERELFQNYTENDDLNYFGLFYSIEESKKSEEEVIEYFETLINPIVLKASKIKSPKKKVKYVFNKVHEKLFLFYKIDALFPDIFKSASYNCLTATALYAIVFDKLDIPYSIIELPSHVYLVAYPDTEEIAVETTDPEQGYINITNNFKKQYVDYIKSSKLLKKEDLNLDYPSIFEKYFFANGKIDLKQLLGLHYYNHTIFLLDNADYENAIKQIEKAFMFNQSPKLKLLYMSCLALQLDAQSFNKKKEVDVFAKFAKYFVNDQNREQVLTSFIKLTNYQLEKYPDPDLYEYSFNLLDSVVSDSILKSEIRFTYNYERGRVLIMKGDNRNAFPYLKEAYNVQSSNVPLQTMMSSSIADYAFKLGDLDHAVDTLIKFIETYPEFKENKYVCLAKSYTHLRLANTYLMKKHISKAKVELENFESSLPKDGPTIEMQQFIGYLYSEMSSHYFRKQNKSLAKKYLTKGLEYAPGDYRLEQKLNLLNRN
jgi:hypothetical protein